MSASGKEEPMERRFEVRLEELLDDAVVHRGVSDGMLQRLARFAEPFAACLGGEAQREHLGEYIAGLVSDVPRKSAEAIAYLHDQERQALQKFLGQTPWSDRPLITELARQVGAELGTSDAVLVFDPSSFPKHGKDSVGVARQWCGRLGKVENCQVGIYLGYVSPKEHALVDVRLYLPEEWATDKKRRKKCGVPREARFRTRHALALEMLDEHTAVLPHAWVAGDDEMGRSSAFRRELRERNERYLLAVPSNTLVRDLHAEPPAYAGRGRRPAVPFVRADRWCASLPAEAWTTIEVRDGTQGPLVAEGVITPIQAKTDQRRTGPEEVLVILRERQADGTMKHDYYLANAPAETPLAEFARVAKAEHRIEECLQRAKSDASMAQYQVRNWIGWHHHQTLSLLAVWFLTRERRRGEKIHPGVDRADRPRAPRLTAPPRTGLRQPSSRPPQHDSPSATQRAGTLLPLEIA
jgi:SRSO17 transposase